MIDSEMALAGTEEKVMTPDRLEEKLKTSFRNCGMPYDVWADVAAEARTEMSASIATDLEALLKSILGDLAAEMYRPGIELVIGLLRREPGPSDAEVSALITAALEPRMRTSLAGPDEIRAWIGSLPKPDDDAFTCVYPQPGCQIDILPATWRERAKEILENYKSHLAEEGMRYQGCCCGHTHLNIPDEGVALLRNAGFLVEHESESYSRD